MPANLELEMTTSEASPLLPSRSDGPCKDGYCKAGSFRWGRWTMHILSTIAIVCIACILGILLLGSGSQNHGDRQYAITARNWSWEAVRSSDKLVWHKCYDDLDCARLEVPLDWLEPSTKSIVALAIIRKNATDLSDYKGPLFVNPGGPGGSGVSMVKEHGDAIHVAVGKNHDIIGFDPRGIGATTPQAHCWERPQEERIWGIQKLGLVDSHPGVIYDLYSHQSLASRNCEAGIGDLTEFLGTASVARDMLKILDETGYSKLRYWGLSYGTVLGGTFAAMFPDRIERMVNDGNVNYAEWYNGTGIHYIEDTDKVMMAFFELCHQAGPSDCGFHAPTASGIQKRLDNLYERLKKHPIQVQPNKTLSAAATGNFSLVRPDIISYSDVKSAVIMSLYQPVLFFPQLARVLQELEAGNGLPFLEMAISRGYRQGAFTCSCDRLKGCKESQGWPLEAVGNGDAAVFVKCGEGSVSPDRDSLEAMEAYNVELQQKSPLSAPVMFNVRLSCAGWQSRTKWNFIGPFDANTSYPILFIGNIADNITPLASAVHNSGYFQDSVVLVQNSYGHTSASAPSKCTAQHRLAYFQNGTLPKNGTVCEADMMPFGTEKANIEAESKKGITEGDEMAVALRSLMRLSLPVKLM